MTDPVYNDLVELEREMREHRKWREAHPIGGHVVRQQPPRPASDRRATKRKYRKKSYAECVAKEICPTCRKARAEHGRMCKSCHEKETERWKKKSTALSQRRAARREAA